MDDRIWRNVECGAQVWEQKLTIPTYMVGKPDKNPMFLEKRVYQGSSGKVYPHPVTDKIYDDKVDKEYTVVCLENKYIFVMIIPELGGRIQRAYDKTNGYDFVYYNHVIKPALVGLTGPWISGGIEFNWPQHHRPSTFDPVEYHYEKNDDGSVTVMVSEIENMFRTKGMASFTLYPDRAYLRIDAKLYNRTDMPQTFLWWANPAVSVNDYTQSIFPPDVHAVMDHGKRDVSKFPIATGVYYKQDYSKGVDISRYKNIPVPTSYMAYHSDYDFVGGYDYSKDAGILHVADHHISPGKKQWTWGCGDFGKAWDRNLTDEDGPYIELMTGCFTDNQPDFTWLMPYEEKNFTQYFMPYKTVGQVKNASKEAAIGLEDNGDNIIVRLYVTEPFENGRLVLKKNEKTLYERKISLSPESGFEDIIKKDDGFVFCGTKVEFYRENGELVLSYEEKDEGIPDIPQPAVAPPLPSEVRTNEDLFLYGQHIEQYRHATYLPEDYYTEGLRRDPTDARINNAYGLLLLRRGRIEESEKYFREAIKKLTRSNPNPYDSEAFYNLGLCLKYRERYDEAFDAFFKATWSEAQKARSEYQLALIEARRKRYEEALNHLDDSLVYNAHNLKARTIKTAILRKIGRAEEAKREAEITLEIDRMDIAALYELSKSGNAEKEELLQRLQSNHNYAIEISLEYSDAGFYDEAKELLSYCERKDGTTYPMIHYHIAYDLEKAGKEEEAEKYLEKAKEDIPDYCFPHRIEDMIVLEDAVSRSERDYKALYYLGNLYYDKRNYGKAIDCWEKSVLICDSFPTTHRNLALAYYNKEGRVKEALKELERAYAADPEDARVLMELDQLYKKTGTIPEKRREKLESHMTVVEKRDDLYLEYISLCNMAGEYEKALRLINKRKFHPWEGGEGKVPAQYTAALSGLACKELAEGDFAAAAGHLNEALSYPENLGEGKLSGAQENNIYYYLGEAYEGLGETEKAREAREHASKGLTEPAGMMYYNDQPPETIFYQGMALLRLGREDEAYGRFNKLIDYGEKHLKDNVLIDYFAVSLPDLLIFDEDYNKKNRVHCLFMMALGYIGKNDMEKAGKLLKEAETLDANHYGVKIHKKFKR